MTDTTTIMGDGLSWLVECLDRMADYDDQCATSAENEAQRYTGSDPEYRDDLANKAKWMREDANQTRTLYELVRGATSITITK